MFRLQKTHRFAAIISFFCVWCYAHVDVQAGILTVQQTDQSGGQTDLDSSQSYFWAFSNSDTTPMWNTLQAKFVLKRNGSASAPAVLKLFQADSGSNSQSELYQTSLAVSAATASYTEYTLILYNAATQVALPDYFNLTFESATGTNGSQQWFIKGNIENSSFTFSDANGPITSITYLGAGSGTSGGSSSFQSSTVPEPGSAVTLGLLGVYGFAKRRRFTRKR